MERTLEDAPSMYVKDGVCFCCCAMGSMQSNGFSDPSQAGAPRRTAFSAGRSMHLTSQTPMGPRARKNQTAVRRIRFASELPISEWATSRTSSTSLTPFLFLAMKPPAHELRYCAGVSASASWKSRPSSTRAGIGLDEMIKRKPGPLQWEFVVLRVT